ncbi:autophagy protein 12-like [Sitophilus oryzae]|uniref:Ubiquitin-like protein ATG12 n=1 Tax=Sitophilus oryzae TaxID=7048 RepID=A0A6J2YCU8_SITOR|nr:autophagy protein 12-like [Sitophilus oryzae]
MSQVEENSDIKEVQNTLQLMNLNTEGESTNLLKTEKQKVDILLKPTGNAPIMKKKKWTVDSDKPIGWIIEFIKKYLKLEVNEKLFLYVNQSFAPSPDQIVRNLYDCYNSEGTLVLHYCNTQAWG